MSRTGIIALLLVALLPTLSGATAAETREVPLTALDLSKMSAGWGKPRANRSIEQKPLRIGGTEYVAGVGSHAPSVLHIRLDGKTRRFSAEVRPRGVALVRLWPTE